MEVLTQFLIADDLTESFIQLLCLLLIRLYFLSQCCNALLIKVDPLSPQHKSKLERSRSILDRFHHFIDKLHAVES